MVDHVEEKQVLQEYYIIRAAMEQRRQLPLLHIVFLLMVIGLNFIYGLTNIFIKLDLSKADKIK